MGFKPSMDEIRNHIGAENLKRVDTILDNLFQMPEHQQVVFVMTLADMMRKKCMERGLRSLEADDVAEKAMREEDMN